MARGEWILSLLAFLTSAGLAWSQTGSPPSPNSDQPADWHQSWDKPYGGKQESKEPDTQDKNQTKPQKPVSVIAKPVSRETLSPDLPELQIDSTQAPQAPPGLASSGEIIFPSVQPPSSERSNAFATWTRQASWETADLLSHDVHLIFEDYAHYWTFRDIGLMAAGVAIAAPLANTSADLSFRNWYQGHVREGWEDRYAYDVKYAGEYTYALPAYFAIAIGGRALEGLDSLIADDGSWVGEVGEVSNQWGQRCIRAMAVGTPMVGILQVGLGSTRPGLGSSYWNPLNASHGVSGHAYVGSIPFLTAAAMTDSPFLKVPLFLGSFLTGWSRIHTDDHYFSQVALGWWMGFLAVRSVNETQEEERTIEFIPGSSEGPGVSMLLRY
jgi:hypothetical protein